MNIHRNSALFVLGLFSSLAGYASGQAVAPAATRPTTAPASQPAFKPSWDTPKEAYLTYTRALMTSDGKTMQQSVAWEKAEDGDLVGRMTPDQSGVKDGRVTCDLLEAQFPEDAQVKAYVKSMREAYDALDDSKKTAEALHAVEQQLVGAQTKMDGDNATLTIPDAAEPVIKFKKIDGQWKLLAESVGMPYAPMNEEMRQEMAKSAKLSFRMMELRREAYANLLKDLQAKKFATGKDAIDALQKLEQDVMKKAMTEQGPGN